MTTTLETDPANKPATAVERTSDRELTVTRSFHAPARLVFEAWSKPELFQRWWVPKSFGIAMESCDMDVRTGGSYRIVMRHPAHDQSMAFFGKYTDVVPGERIVWTNEEEGGAGQVTTVTFEETGGKTRVVMRDLYPSKAALDEAMQSGATGAAPEQFDALAAMLAEAG